MEWFTLIMIAAALVGIGAIAGHQGGKQSTTAYVQQHCVRYGAFYVDDVRYTCTRAAPEGAKQ